MPHDDEDPIDLSEQRRRRQGPGEAEKMVTVLRGVREGRPVSEADAAAAAAFARGYVIAERVARHLFERVLVEQGEQFKLTFADRNKIMAAYDAAQEKERPNL